MLTNSVLHFNSFFTVTIGMMVLFIGRRINAACKPLRELSIPEPVTGGILVSLLMALLYKTTAIEIEFDLAARNFLLVYFFTTIGINTNFKDLLKGGKPLIILLIITIIYMMLQNLTGIGIAHLFRLESAIGVLGGTASLIGGHGTAIAWAPKIAKDYGIDNAMEIGIASATFGLILASLMGGPIAKFLIKRHLLSNNDKEHVNAAVPVKKIQQEITGYDFYDAVFAIHVCIIFGFLLNGIIAKSGLQLPLFVTCLFAGIVITNLVPDSFPRISGTKWPFRKPSIALIAEISLNIFLAMSLMSMQLWKLVDLAGPIFAILSAQFVVAVIVDIFVVFPLMGKTYDAAVICSGFGGISLGSTPTAMANMSAVTQRYGKSYQAFIIVPLVCAFFIDLVNAFIIPYFLTHF